MRLSAKEDRIVCSKAITGFLRSLTRRFAPTHSAVAQGRLSPDRGTKNGATLTIVMRRRVTQAKACDTRRAAGTVQIPR